MSDTSVQTAPSSPLPGASAASAATKKTQKWTALRVLKLLASLKLTVVLFVLSLFLVFFGTLAQIDNGIWTVVADYFRSAFVWVPFQLLVKFGQVFFAFPKDLTIPGSFPFFGGWLLGAALLVNLLAAHLVRFKLSWKRGGILAIHAGLIILMLGELGTGLFAVEQRMTIATGETVAFTDVSHRVELAFTTPDPDDPKKDLVVVIPQRLLSKGGKIANDQLPVDVEVVEYWQNSDLVTPKGDGKLPNQRKALDGQYYGITKESESSGVDTEAREDTPSARVVLYKKGTDEKIGEFFVSLWYYPNMSRRALEFPPQKFTVDGKTYMIDLRPRREYKPYALKLKEFRFDKYEGTETAKNFSSLVDVETAGGQKREFKIFMNNPLFHNGETLYQSGYFPANNGTVLQVVRNPVWWMPYVSCAVVTVGMVVHFLITLVGFLQRRAA